MTSPMQLQMMDVLRESLLRKFVQKGIVTNVKPLRMGGVTQEVLEINFNGVSVFCRVEEFTKRKIDGLAGFLDTVVPFIVTDINPDTHIVEVSRIQALPVLAKRFTSIAKVGDTVRGTVTGVVESTNIVYVDIEGVPAMIPPSQWAMQEVRNLREVVPIGLEVDVKITDIADTKNDPNWDYDIKIRVSRRELLKEERESVWKNIDQHHIIGENVVAKVVAKAPGKNSYLIQVVSSGIIIIGNLQKPLNDQYHYGLPQGLSVQAQIMNLDSEKQRGKARIFRINSTVQQSILGRYGNF